MDQLEEIKARADAARAPCVAYWLIVFVYLMIHLFPVIHPGHEPGYHDKGTVIAAASENDWLPPSGANEIPVLPRVAAIRPPQSFAKFSIVVVIEAHPAPMRGFNPRGPPAIT
jgi:hypothetical protein